MCSNDTLFIGNTTKQKNNKGDNKIYNRLESLIILVYR